MDLSRILARQKVEREAEERKANEGKPCKKGVPDVPGFQGSISEAKRIEILRSRELEKSHAHNKDRLKGKLRTKLRQFDRHKKESAFIQSSSSIDWIFKHDEMLFDFLMFGVSCTMAHSYRAMLPHALSLFNRYLRGTAFKAQEMIMNMLSNCGVMQSSISLDGAETLNDVASWYKKYRDSTVWDTCKKLYVYVICLALHGVEKCAERDIMKMAERSILKKFEDSADVVVNIATLLKSLLTNFYQCVQSGRWSDFFHSEDVYTKWYNDNLEVERIMTDFIIPNDAQDVIERSKLLIKQGEEMLRAMRYQKMPQKEVVAVHARLSRTREILAKFTGSILGTQMRRQPFCIFVSGKSKIGKSSFMKANHLLYARLHRKDPSLEPFMRMPGTNFWDGYQPNQWALTYDDVCAHNPNQVMGIDDFHAEFLHVSNCMPKLAECAALEDKGSKPLLFDLIQVSSNVDDLSAHVYFQDTAALVRRLQHRVRLAVKSEYLGTDGFLDPSKIPTADGFPDIWRISIDYATTTTTNAITTPASSANMEKGTWVPIKELQNIDAWTYMQWFAKRSHDHVKQQTAFLLAMKNTEDSPLCDNCGLFVANHPGGVKCEQAAAYIQSGRHHIFGELEETKDEEIVIQSPRVNHSQAPQPTWWQNWGSFRPSNPFSGISGSQETTDMFFLCMQNTVKFVNSYFSARGPRDMWFIRVIQVVLQFLYDYFVAVCVRNVVTTGPWWFGLPLGTILACILWPFKAMTLFQVEWCYADYFAWFINVANLYISSQIFDAFHVVRQAGAMMFHSMGGNARLLALIVALVAAMTAGILVYRTFFREERAETDVPIQLGTFTQGGNHSVNMLPGVEPENVWRRRDYRCSVIDIPLPSSSLKGATDDTLVSYFQRNLNRVDFLWETEVEFRVAVTGGSGLFLGGTKILFMTHFMDKKFAPKDALRLIGMRVHYWTKSGVERSRHVAIEKLEIEYFDEQTSIVDFPAIPPQRVLQANIPDSSMLSYVGPGLQIGRQKDGSLVVAKCKKIWCENFQGQMSWVVTTASGPNKYTIEGDCGSILLALTNQGPVMVGLHLYLNAEMTKSYSYNLCGKDFGFIISSAPPDLSKPGKVGNLGELHEKSPIQYLEDLEGIEILGSFDGFRAAPKSHVTKTLGADFLIEKHGFALTHGKPVMRGKEVRWRHLQEFKKLNTSIPQYKIETCSQILLNHVLSYRKPEWKAFILSQHDAINGVAGYRFIDRIPINTSVGFPFRGPKTNFIKPIVEGDWTSTLLVNDELQEMIDFCFKRWSSGLRAAPVFTASLKDEARKFSKIEEKNTRVFFGGPAAFIIAQRQVFTWFTRLVQTNPLIFMQAPGMDANGAQWNLLAKYLLKHDNYIAGDFKDFDMSMVVQVLRQSYKFIIQLGQHLGASAEHVKLMTAAAEDLVYPIVDYFGDLIQGTGKNPSGQALTVHVNGLVNALYMIFCYVELHPEASQTDPREKVIERGAEFFRHTRFIFYGDDNLGSVSGDVPWFNHTAISHLLGAHDVVYTMADKGAKSVPYISFSEVTFLKRRFRFEEDVQGFVAPLEEASIKKALLLHVPSGVVSDQEAYAQTIAGQNDMMWHHGREKFEQFRQLLLELIVECDLVDYFSHRRNRPMLADWDELKSRWIQSRENRVNFEWCLPEDRVSLTEDLPQVFVQSSSHIEFALTSCSRCGRCPFVLDDDDEVEECPLCGGCRIYGDPWCIVCQEDGFCSCGGRLVFSRSIWNGSEVLRLYLACEECDTLRVKVVPLTISLAAHFGITLCDP